MLVFDEIDAGIGGHTARAVGEQLRALAAGRQVLCITHLPQVAALAERHFTIVKDGPVTAGAHHGAALEGEEVVGELVRMLGAGERRSGGQGARRASCCAPLIPQRAGLRVRAALLGVRAPRYRATSLDSRSHNMPKDASRQAGDTRFIFVTGGVVSSLGKGIAAASIGRLLVARGLQRSAPEVRPVHQRRSRARCSPYQHGEVFVTEDGAETDLDLGHYERFTDANTSRASNVTAGGIYNTVIRRSAAATTSAPPSRWSRTSPTRSSSASG